MVFFGRFFGWIMLFLFLLGAIPILILMESSNAAKLLGILLVVGIVVALWYWRIQTRVRSPRNQRVRINTNDRFWLNDNIPFYNKLSEKDKVIFEDRIGIFLADIQVTEVNKEVADKETCFYVASSAVIAYWGLPYWNYGRLSEVLVYPTNFDIDNSLNKLGIVQGKVHHGGLMDTTIIISLPALIQGFRIANDKKNVGVHEFAHLLDKSEGSIDGIPPFMGESDRKLWITLVDKEIEKIKQDKSNLPEYAAKNHAEFFAVAVEYFKECPELLRIKHPELHAALSKLYNEK
jgi:Mlc titration factor MtfA (ptsG expression regulator)